MQDWLDTILLTYLLVELQGKYMCTLRVRWSNGETTFRTFVIYIYSMQPPLCNISAHALSW